MATVELLPDWEQHNPDTEETWPFNDVGRVADVAGAFGGISSSIGSNNDSDTIQYAFEDSPADVNVVSQIDVKIEARYLGGGSLDAQLNIDGQGQGVVNQEVTGQWATYTFGAWQGPWNRDSLETSFITFRTSGGSKSHTVRIATVRLVPTYTVLTGHPPWDLYAGGMSSVDGGMHG